MKKQIQKIITEYEDACRMYDKIAFDPRRKLDQPCEKLNYWDGKKQGLKTTLQILERRVRKEM